HRNFYALRHTFETVGGETKDQVAVDYLMGHSRDDRTSVYRERISDERLKAVVGHIQTWLFGDGKAPAPGPGASGLEPTGPGTAYSRDGRGIEPATRPRVALPGAPSPSFTSRQPRKASASWPLANTLPPQHTPNCAR